MKEELFKFLDVVVNDADAEVAACGPDADRSCTCACLYYAQRHDGCCGSYNTVYDDNLDNNCYLDGCYFYCTYDYCCPNYDPC